MPCNNALPCVRNRFKAIYDIRMLERDKDVTTKCLFTNLKFQGSVAFAAFLLLFLACFGFCPFCLVQLSFSVAFLVLVICSAFFFHVSFVCLFSAVFCCILLYRCCLILTKQNSIACPFNNVYF